MVGPELAAVLGIPWRTSDDVAAAALARVAGLPPPQRPETKGLLAAVVEALQRHVVDFPNMPLDRAAAADTAVSLAARAAGTSALRITFEELGGDSLDVAVRRALHDRVLPALIRRGAIQLVGG
jgi:hypothetical protein